MKNLSKKVYYWEVGVEDKNEEPIPFDKIPYGTFEENTGEFKTLKETLDYVTNYIKMGKNTTYGIIAEVEVDEEEYNTINNGTSDLYDYSNMFTGKLKYSAYKDKNGKYIVVFDEGVNKNEK